MHYSLFAGMLGALAGGDVCAAVRIGNASRNINYAQPAGEQRAAQVASVNDISRMSGNSAPVVAESGDDTSVNEAEMAACSAIYPGGEFDIARPDAGTGKGGDKTCVAVVELRGYQMGETGKDVVLARAYVAAGSKLICNISNFPESSYTLDVQRVTFPADEAPTEQDVVKVMNQEQKQNAGLKIAAAALVGGLGGNISGKNDTDKDGLFGTSDSKIKNTVIGAVGGAAIGAASSYTGYQAGNMIMSVGVNAAAGGVVGNIVSTGNSVLRIERCNKPDSEERANNTKPEMCLWGYLINGKKLTSNTTDDKSLCTEGSTTDCYRYFIDLDDRTTVMRCKKADNEQDSEDCTTVSNLVSIYVKKDSGSVAMDGIKSKDIEALKNDDANSYHMSTDMYGTENRMTPGSGAIGHTYKLITSAKISNGKKAVVIRGFEDKAFGLNDDYWDEWKDENKNTEIHYRNSDGTMGDVYQDAKLEDFKPVYMDAENGEIIDLNNKARLKSTLIGAGAGGALGALSAYQGAQSDIDERWVAAVREYKDSLQKFFCQTGNRFLSYYNDPVIIPNVSE